VVASKESPPHVLLAPVGDDHAGLPELPSGCQQTVPCSRYRERSPARAASVFLDEVDHTLLRLPYSSLLYRGH
jgi:hypothetical protein